MDESRKAFEQWYLLSWGHTEDNHETLFEIGPDDGLYYRLGVRLAYNAWQASRAAIEIELPSGATKDDKRLECETSHEGSFNLCLYHASNAIRAAGIKVKE